MRRAVLAAVLLAVAALVRLDHLAADPPLTFGAAHLTDEGYYTKNPKEWLRSGHWTRDGDNHNHVHLAPLTAVAFAAGFKALGISLEAARTTSALAGLVTLAALALLLYRFAGPDAALFALALGALEPALVASSRVALAEGLQVAASSLFVLALTVDLERRRFPVLALGCFLLALLVKASAIALIPLTVLALVLDRLSRRRQIDSPGPIGGAAGLVGGLTTIVAAWYFLYVQRSPGARFMFSQEFGAHVSGEGALGPLRMLLRTLLETRHPTQAFAADPLLAGVAATAAVLVVFECLRGRRVNPLEVTATAWLAGTGLFFSAMPYQPPRYFLILAAPATVLAAVALADPRAWLRRLTAALPGGIAVAGLVMAGTTAVTLRALSAIDLRGGLASSRGAAAGLGLALTFLTLTLFARGRRLAAAALLVLAPVCTLLAWRVHLTSSMAAISDDLTQRLGPDDVVVGYFAPTFTLETAARGVVVHGPWNPGPDALARLHATHLLVRAEELRWLLDRDPGLKLRLEPQVSYAPQGGARGTLSLYRLRSASRPLRELGRGSSNWGKEPSTRPR